MHMHTIFCLKEDLTTWKDCRESAEYPGFSIGFAQTAVVIVDNLVKHELLACKTSTNEIILRLNEVLIHELIHLCGVRDEIKTFRGTWLLISAAKEEDQR